MDEQLEKPKGGKKGAIIAVIALAIVIAAAVFVYQALPDIQAGMPYELTPDGAISQEDTDSLFACEIERFDGVKSTIKDVSDASGKPMVINMWASWCTHCEAEMNAYQQLSEEYGDRIEFVMLDIPDTKSEYDAAKKYVEDHGYTFPAYYDTDMNVATTLNVIGIPVLVIISPAGDVVLNRTGEVNYNALKGTFDNVLRLG